MMNKETKEQVIERLTLKFGRTPYSYEVVSAMNPYKQKYHHKNYLPEVGTVGMGHPRMFATHAAS